MRRREFVTFLGCAAATWPFAGRAQQPGKVYRIGILAVAVGGNWNKLFDGLRDHGYAEGQNLIIEWRYSEGQADRWPELASELVGLKVDVIIVDTTPAALAAMKATRTIPIVIPTAFDPVGAGLASSLAKPGGNVTGLGILVPEVSGKALALLKEALPHLTRVAVLWNAANAANALVMRSVEATARAEGLAIQSQQIRQPRDLDVAFAGITQDRPEGLLVVTDALLGQYQGRIADFAKHRQLPAVSNFRDFAELGGLMSYGPNLPDMYRIAASYVDRVLKGTKPADLPIAQPTKFELVINLMTAKVLGLEVPATLVARADEVIE